jgi:DNA-binding transcriptional LysR family regulator
MDAKLETFLTVCETKKFTAAAKKLNLTQPAISQHIKLLEQEYDVKLFARVNNEMVLTKYGEILYKYALRIQSLYSSLSRKMIDSKKYTRSLTIGITHTSESNITPEILADYSIQNEGVYIKIVSDTINNLYEKLNNYQIDLAIIEGKINSKKISSILLGQDSLMAVMSPLNPLSNKSVITIDDLKKENLIVRTLESGTTSLFIDELEKNNLSLDDFHIHLEIDSVSSIKELLKKNLGVSILARSACKKEIDDKELVVVPIENLNMIREISLAYIEGSVDSDVIDDISSTYREKVSY